MTAEWEQEKPSILAFPQADYSTNLVENFDRFFFVINR